MNKITELMGINNAPDFVRTNLCDDELIIANAYNNSNTSSIDGDFRGELVIVFHSFINNNLKALLVQAEIYKCT